MSAWRSVAGIDVLEQRRILELLPFGLVELRAKMSVHVEYDPEKLTAKEADLAEQAERDRAAFAAEFERNPNMVMPIGTPAFRGQKPWLADVPMRNRTVSNEIIEPGVISALGVEMWETGRTTLFDDEDYRIRWLLAGIEYRDISELYAEVAPDEARGIQPATAPAKDEPSPTKLEAWAREWRAAQIAAGQSLDWKRKGQKALEDAFPGHRFKKDAALTLARELGFGRAYRR